MSRLGIPFQGAMVLAGEGGDLGVMDGMGFPMNKVVAVDRDPFMVDWCKHHYPDVIPGKGELMDVAASGILPYNTAHIDMCGGVRLVDNLITVAPSGPRHPHSPSGDRGHHAQGAGSKGPVWLDGWCVPRHPRAVDEGCP